MTWHFAEPHKSPKYGEMVASNMSQKIKIYLDHGQYTLFIDDHEMARVNKSVLGKKFKCDFDKWMDAVFEKDSQKIANTEYMITETRLSIGRLKNLWRLTGR